MEQSTVLPLVTALTSDLRPSDEIQQNQILEAQRDIAQALQAGQNPQSLASGGVVPGPVSEGKLVQQAALDAVDPLSTSGNIHVFRQDGNDLAFTPDLDMQIGSDQQAIRTHGPFLDRSGRSVTFDVTANETFTPLSLLTGDPVMYLSMPEQRQNPFQSRLGPGDVRVRASVFTSDAPLNGFFNLKILSGQVFRPPVDTIPRSVSLTLAPPDQTVVNPAGVVINPPAIVVFGFQVRPNQPSAFLNTLGQGNCQVLGNQFTLQFNNTANPAWDAQFRRINFPVTSDLSTLDPTENPFKLVDFSGQAKIVAAAWSLPVVVEQPVNFGPSIGSLGYAIGLQAGLFAGIDGQAKANECGNCVLIIQQGGIRIDGTAGRPSTKEAQILNLGVPNRDATTGDTDRKSFITFRSSSPLTFTFMAIGNIRELWRAQVSVESSLDQPRTVNNERIPYNQIADLRLLRHLDDGTTEVNLVSSVQEVPTSRHSFALQNALFTTRDARRLNLAGRYEQGTVAEGILILEFPLIRTLPVLPDPYATNIKIITDEQREALGTAVITSSWTANSAIAVKVDLGSSPFARLQTVDLTVQSQLQFDPSFVAEQKALFSYDDFVVTQQPQQTPSPMLLDVSSNAAQFGVMFPIASTGNTVADLMLQAPANELHIVTLPSVSWEPVREVDDTLFSTNAGPTTRLAARSQTKPMPISPKEALNSIVSNFSTSAPVSARFSLPFGMVALVDATPPALPFLPSAERTILKQVQPEFSLDPASPGQLPASIKGVDQVSLQRLPGFRPLIPVGSTSLTGPSNTNSPSFPGATALLKTFSVSVDGSSAATDILRGSDPISTAVSDAFLRDMPQKVPLTRIDLTGYGESTFSDWRFLPQVTPQNPSGTGISKVAFQVLNGRTARETVRLNTVMAPFAVKVVRQVDIVRLNNGAVIRKDSGWQATSDGTYKYDQPDIVSFPGLVLRVTNITNIRDVTNELVKYDCILVIDDPSSPNGERQVPAHDHTGFVFVSSTPAPPAITNETVKNVLANNKLGGDLDFVLSIGKSTQQMRITSMTASPAQPGGVVAIWGSPLFQGQGQWSMTRQATNTDKFPQPVDGARGVPLVRDGRHDSDLHARTTPYLMREPGELLDDIPNTVYGIVHGTPSFRVLFQRPEIPFSLPSPDAIPSILTQGIKVADKYALAKAQGIFPELQSCLPVGEDVAKQALQIVNGNYKFLPSEMNLANTASRLIKSDSAFTSLVSTIGDTTLPDGDIINPATLNLAIDTAQQISNLNIKNLALETLNGERKVASKVVSDLQDEAHKIGDMLDVRHLYGPALEQVRKVVSFLEHLKVLPNFQVTMTNAWGMQMSTTMTRKELLEKAPNPVVPLIEKIMEQFDLALKLVVTLVEFQFDMHIKVTIKVPTGFGPVALGVGGLDVGLGTVGTSLSLELGCGIGVDFQVGPFSASASYAQSQTIMARPDGWGVGVTATLRAHVDLVIASANLFLEAKLLLVGGICNKHQQHQNHGTTIFAYAQVRICLEVSIFLVVHVKVDEETHWENRLNHGVCLLDDMIDLHLN